MREQLGQRKMVRMMVHVAVSHSDMEYKTNSTLEYKTVPENHFNSVAAEVVKDGFRVDNRYYSPMVIRFVEAIDVE
jgi:hypothetical protein